jgi:glucose/arabinose dehydrogenase
MEKPTEAPLETFGPIKFPESSAYIWQPVVSGLNAPVGLVHAGDDSGRLFVIEQRGRVRILREGSLLPGAFLDIRDRVGSRGSEQGFLGLAFHPDYTQNGFFYVNYTDQSGDTVIARFGVSADNPDLADSGTEILLLSVRQPYGNHNGGVLAFGPDGYLYAGLGDGGSAGDPQNNGQSLDTLLGKILRIDVDGDQPYAIPFDNPFVEGGGRAEIWAYGLRNPWRFSFDRFTGDLYIGDVGQNQWEEINFLAAGSPGGVNFGWSYYEGRHIYSDAPPADLTLISPVAEYNHNQGCSVTGGVVYRGQNLPEWQGVYLFGDFCTGRIWGLLRMSDGLWLQQVLFEGLGQISSFGEDQAGEIYYIDHSGGIYRLEKK